MIHARLAHLLEVLTHPVSDHHGFVHRVAQNGQNARQHGQIELPSKDGEQAENDDDVVQVGDDGRDRKAPFESNRQITHDARDHQQ